MSMQAQASAGLPDPEGSRGSCGIYQSESLRAQFLGTHQRFAAVRAIQDSLVRKRIAGELAADHILFCEHSPTLSMGWRARAEDLYLDPQEYFDRGIEIVQADRGGQITYHGPGQLVIYPVVSLRERGLGIKRFIELIHGAIIAELEDFGLAAFSSLDPAGIWVPGIPGGVVGAGTDNAIKIGSVGLRVDRGVTNHGFSLNVANDAGPYELFASCGDPNAAFTCVVRECGDRPSTSYTVLSERIAQQLAARVDKLLNAM